MTVRILCWNIKNFSDSTLVRAGARTRILNLVHPAAAARDFDIFVIVEPVTGKVGRGNAATGAGVLGSLALLGDLRARANGGAGWMLIPMICLRDNGEAIAVFYHADALVCRGPGNVTYPAWEDAPQQGDIRWIDDAGPPIIVAGRFDEARGPTAMIAAQASYAIEPVGGHVYSIDPRSNRIHRCNADGTAPAVLGVAAQGGVPASIGMDPTGNLVFWIDGSNGALCRGDLTTGAADVCVAGAAAGAQKTLVITPSKVVWIDATNHLCSANHDGSAAAPLIAVGVVSHPCAVGDIVYWVDATGRICGLNVVSGATFGPFAPPNPAGGLAATAQMIYWVDATTQHIHAYNLTANTHASIVAAVDAGTPRALSAGTHLFWVNDASQDIKVAALDGTLPHVLVAALSAGQPRGLCLGANALYWCDAASNEIRRLPSAGVAAACVLAPAAGLPTAVASRGNKMAWIDDHARLVVCAGDDGSGPSTFAGLAVAIRAWQPADKLCWIDRLTKTIRETDLLGGNLVVTAAPDATEVAVSGATTYWLKRAANEIWWRNPAGGAPAIVVPSVTAQQPVSIAVSTRTNKLYWVSLAQHAIYGADLNGTNDAKLVDAPGTPAQLTVSPAHDYMSWIDTTSNELRVGACAGRRARIIATGAIMGTPLAHAVAPTGNWSGQALSTSGGVIPIWQNGKGNCPFRVRFLDRASNYEFDLVSHHAPEPGEPLKLASATRIQNHAAITGTARIIYMGDLNLCGLNGNAGRGTCDDPKPDHDDCWDRIDDFTQPPCTMQLVVHSQLSSLKTVAAGTDGNWCAHAYDHIISKGHTGFANNIVVDLVQPMVTAYNIANGTVSPLAANLFRSAAVFGAIRHNGSGAAARGISDHLPIKADVDF